MALAFSCASFSSEDVGPANDAATDTPSSDAEGDAGPATDAGARLCALNADAAICDDFDDSVLDPRWHVTEVNAGTVVLGPPAKSLPNAVVFAAPPSSDSSGEARIDRAISGKIALLTCTFDMMFDTFPMGGFEFAHLDVKGGGMTSLLTLTTDAIKTDDGGFKAATAMGVGVWEHYDLVVDFVAQSATISKDNGPPSTVSIGDFPVPETTVVSFGLRFKPDGDVHFRIDTLLCEAKY